MTDASQDPQTQLSDSDVAPDVADRVSTRDESPAPDDLNAEQRDSSQGAAVGGQPGPQGEADGQVGDDHSGSDADA